MVFDFFVVYAGRPKGIENLRRRLNRIQCIRDRMALPRLVSLVYDDSVLISFDASSLIDVKRSSLDERGKLEIGIIILLKCYIQINNYDLFKYY